MFKNFLQDETGAELAEYAVGVALLVAIGVVVYEVLGDAIYDFEHRYRNRHHWRVLHRSVMSFQR